MSFDALFCDECQMFRRLPMKSGHSNVVGVSSAGSDKCLRHQEKTHYTLYHYEKGRVVFATATPLENSIAEQYVYQRYLQEEDLTYLSLRSIKRWFSEFTEPVQYYGVVPNGKDFKLKTKLRFHNLLELNRMVRAFTNFYLIRSGGLSLPRCKGFTDVAVFATDEEIAYYEDIAGKLDDLSQGLINRKEFNQLTAVVLARMAALDIRLADSDSNPPKGTTKIEACAEKIKDMYKKYPDKSQVVFCDTEVPKEGFNLYDSLKTLLVETGLFRESEVRFIHEAKTPVARRKMLEDFNQACIKVMIGSTQKVGVVVNIQKNLITAHFLDVPWTPAKLQQKIGRIIRAGNTCEEVYLFRYIKQRSFDAFSWETIESKLDFINQYNSYQFGDNCREEDDITALTEITCAEAKALALDDNNIKKHTELKNEISRVKAAYRARAKQLQDLKEKTEYLPGQIEKHERYVEIISEDMNHYKQVRCEVSMVDREKLGGKVLEFIKNNSYREFEYQSFQIEVPVRNKKMDTLLYSAIWYSRGTISYQCKIKYSKGSLSDA